MYIHVLLPTVWRDTWHIRWQTLSNIST